MDVDILQQFISCTGADEDFALSFLETNGWDLEHCVNLYLEGNNNPPPPPAKSSSPIIPADFEEEVRAPIEPKSEVLVEEDPMFRLIQQQRRRQQQQRSGFNNKANTNVFEMFRDFQREATFPPVGDSNAEAKKLKTLADLFRPPMDLLETGPFEQVKQKAAGENKYLLVNIQATTEFDCQKLNRDTWSDPKVKAFVSHYFMLWQVLESSDDGTRYVRFYPIDALPHIAVIDSRTGERLHVIHGFVSPSQLIQSLTAFLEAHPFDGLFNGVAPAPVAPIPIPTSPRKRGDLDEEEQLMAAIAASLAANPQKEQTQEVKTEDVPVSASVPIPIPIPTQPFTSTTVSNPPENEKQETKPQETIVEKQEDNNVDESLLAEHSNPSAECTCVIQIRLPSGPIKGHFRPSDKLSLVRDYVRLHLKTPFKLFTTFPKRVIEGALLDQTLQEADLTPRAVLNCEQV